MSDKGYFIRFLIVLGVWVVIALVVVKVLLHFAGQ